MKEFRFRTTINDDTCLATVTPFLNEEKSIEHWEVNTNDPEKILTASGKDATSESIRQAVEKAGFEARLIQAAGSGGSL